MAKNEAMGQEGMAGDYKYLTGGMNLTIDCAEYVEWKRVCLTDPSSGWPALQGSGDHGHAQQYEAEGTKVDGNIAEGIDAEGGYEDTDYLALMQRRKRGRSPTPRRRRRGRMAEEARRAANRERWTTMGAPSRAPALTRTRISSTRLFPPAPWSRSSKVAKDDEVEVCLDEEEPAAASSSAGAGGAGFIPGLDDLDPRIRWWTDVVGLTNPMNSTKGLNVLGPNTTNTIISNLQGQGEVERARTVQSLLSFVGLFIAELLRAVHDAEHGEIVHLMQQALSVGPGSFAKSCCSCRMTLRRWEKKERPELPWA